MRINTLYLGGGGPADPDLMRGVATLGARTISVLAVSTSEQAVQGRVQALAVAFAYRLKSRLGA